MSNLRNLRAIVGDRTSSINSSGTNLLQSKAGQFIPWDSPSCKRTQIPLARTTPCQVNKNDKHSARTLHSILRLRLPIWHTRCKAFASSPFVLLGFPPLSATNALKRKSVEKNQGITTKK
uniref:Uncharacterized protein n=1 Tax=Romanomermis culicivorax TaxID=13658 RepID=A0A915JBD8_ROMCU